MKMSDWHYEYEGKKHGPVPSSVLKHLVKHGVIQPSTQIWKGEQTAVASDVKSLFPPDDCESARKILSAVLEAETHDDDSLAKSEPSLSIICPWSSHDILLEYDILRLDKVPIGRYGDGIKPLVNVFAATLSAVLCDRPSNRMSFAAIQANPQNKRFEFYQLICKQFSNGMWVFMDADLANGT